MNGCDQCQLTQETYESLRLLAQSLLIDLMDATRERNKFEDSSMRLRILESKEIGRLKKRVHSLEAKVQIGDTV